jgi:hypothetical protein
MKLDSVEGFVPKRQREMTDEEVAREFDRVLLKAEASEFENLITDLPQLLRSKSNEFLRICKSLVDARLKAEPVKNVFSLSDPHEIRVGYWCKIAERFEAEINFRPGPSAMASQNPKGATRGSDPEVAKRRSIVEANLTKSAHDLWKHFDLHQVPLPREWQDEFSVKSWPDAYDCQELRHRVEALVSRDKKAAKP